MPYQPGDILLDKYRIESLLDRGAFAEVYLATHLGLDAKRALKVLRSTTPGIGSTEFNNFFDRFQLEAQLGARLDHPKIIDVYDFEQDGETLILVMEHAAGGTLTDRLKRAREANQNIPLDEAIQIACAIAEGLSAIHKLEAVHRDLKPSNILFDAEGRPKVADLGLAQIPGGPSMRSRISQPVPHPGTPGYMSPEQASQSGYLTPASDVYALGLILFEVLTGRIYGNQPPGTRVRALRDQVPAWFDQLVADMLAENPDSRPWDGAEVAARLREPEVEEEPPPFVRHLILPALVGFIALVVVVIIWWFFKEPDKETSGQTESVVAVLPTNTLPILITTTVPTLSPTVEKEPSITPTRTPQPTRTPTTMPTTAGPPARMSDDHGVQMVLVPAEAFMMGVDGDEALNECQQLCPYCDCQRSWFEDAEPLHRVNLDDFYIDLYEVTNSRYAECVNAGVCATPSETGYFEPGEYFENVLYSDHPVMYVSWTDAQTYCSWRGARLPTEAEWEKAARGTDRRNYPWGNAFDGNRVNFCDSNCDHDWADPDYNDRYDLTAPVGSYAQGASPYGVLDMAGNVLEWVADWYESEYYGFSPLNNPTGPNSGDYRVVRGGAWNSNGSYVQVTYRVRNSPTDKKDRIGFRCARSP